MLSVCVRVWASPTFPCMLSHLCAFDRITSACVCLKERMAVNNDITSASVNHSPPPTEQEVVRARKRKQEHQEWKRSVFAPAGWWACEQGKREDKKRTRKKSCCCCCWWWWAYGKTKSERMERKTLSKDGDQRRLPVICVPLWGSLCFPLFVTVFSLFVSLRPSS